LARIAVAQYHRVTGHKGNIVGYDSLRHHRLGGHCVVNERGALVGHDRDEALWRIQDRQLCWMDRQVIPSAT
jgi:hypothetical protein